MKRDRNYVCGTRVLDLLEWHVIQDWMFDPDLQKDRGFPANREQAIKYEVKRLKELCIWRWTLVISGLTFLLSLVLFCRMWPPSENGDYFQNVSIGPILLVMVVLFTSGVLMTIATFSVTDREKPTKFAEALIALNDEILSKSVFCFMCREGSDTSGVGGIYLLCTLTKQGFEGPCNKYLHHLALIVAGRQIENPKDVRLHAMLTDDYGRAFWAANPFIVLPEDWAPEFNKARAEYAEKKAVEGKGKVPEGAVAVPC